MRVNKQQLETARRSHGKADEIERSRKGVCMQVKKAMKEQLGAAPRWIEWEKLVLRDQTELPPSGGAITQATLPLHLLGY